MGLSFAVHQGPEGRGLGPPPAGDEFERLEAGGQTLRWKISKADLRLAGSPVHVLYQLWVSQGLVDWGAELFPPSGPVPPSITMG